MEVSIDPSVKFTLRDGELKVRVDALDLEELVAGLWETKAEPKKDAQGNLLGDERFLPFKVIEDELRAFIKKTNSDVELTRSELRGIWAHAPRVWAKKNESWQEQEDASPTSQPATDLLQAD